MKITAREKKFIKEELDSIYGFLGTRKRKIDPPVFRNSIKNTRNKRVLWVGPSYQLSPKRKMVVEIGCGKYEKMKSEKDLLNFLDDPNAMKYIKIEITNFKKPLNEFVEEIVRKTNEEFKNIAN